MKKAFPYFFFTVLALSACGQKGSLYLGEKKVTEKAPVFTSKAPEIAAKPDIIHVNQSLIAGKLAAISSNALTIWEAVLSEKIEGDTNLIRYIVFDYNVKQTNTDNPIELLIGTIQAAPKPAIPQRALRSGTYLRFRSKEKGYTHVPTLLKNAKSYLQRHSQWVPLTQPNFLTDNQQFLDLYIPVERK